MSPWRWYRQGASVADDRFGKREPAANRDFSLPLVPGFRKSSFGRRPDQACPTAASAGAKRPPTWQSRWVEAWG
jgi:hypothetical protein